MRPLAALASITLAAACSVPDPDHCSNRSETCQDLGLGAYCSTCIADNNGCVAQPPSDACLHGAPAPASSTSAPTTSSTSSETTDPSTSTPSPSSSEGSSSTTATDTSSSGSSSSSTTTPDTGDTTATTEPLPTCGDGKRDPGEQCDGDDLDDATCNSANQKWGGGTLKCTADCKAFDQSECCLNVGQTCVPGSMEPNQTCCAGDCILTCT